MGRAVEVELVILTVGLLGIGCVVIAVGLVAQALTRAGSSRRRRTPIAAWRARRLARARATTPWVWYSRPHLELPVQVIGIERVWRGHVLNRKQLAAVPINDLDARLNAEGQAIVAAQEHNNC